MCHILHMSEKHDIGYNPEWICRKSRRIHLLLFLKSFFQMHAFKDILCSIFNGFMYYRAVELVHLDKKHQNDLQIFPEHGTDLALIIGR